MKNKKRKQSKEEVKQAQLKDMVTRYPYNARVRVNGSIWKGKEGKIVGYLESCCQPLVELDGINDKTSFKDDWKTINPVPHSEMPPMRFPMHYLEVID